MNSAPARSRWGVGWGWCGWAVRMRTDSAADLLWADRAVLRPESVQVYPFRSDNSSRTVRIRTASGWRRSSSGRWTPKILCLWRSKFYLKINEPFPLKFSQVHILMHQSIALDMFYRKSFGSKSIRRRVLPEFEKITKTTRDGAHYKTQFSSFYGQTLHRIESGPQATL